MSLLMEGAGPSAVFLSETNAELHRKIAALTAALQQIADMGPMAVDDQRWRIAREAITASGLPKASPPVES